MTYRRPGRLRGLRSRMIATFALATVLWIIILVGAGALGIKLGLGEGLAETRRTISLINWTQSTIDRIEDVLEDGGEVGDIQRELLTSEHDPQPRVRIVGLDGTVLRDTAAGDQAPTPAKLSAEHVLRLIPASDPAEPLHGTGQQIRVDDRLWGFLILTFQPGEEVYRFVSEPEQLWKVFSRTIIAGLLFSLLAVYLTFYAFARRLVVPLRELAFQVSRIGEGELPEPTEWPDRSDEIGVLAGSLNDMTAALSQSRERLKQENERRRLMVSALGHDLRTPVTAIISHTEALESGAATDPPNSMSTIRRRAEHMQHLIADLLAYASVGTTPDAAHTTIDIAEVARETVISILPRFEQRGIEVDASIPDSRIEVTGSRRALQRVFDNVLGNTLEHATGATRVGVSITASSRNVKVAVSDDGPGIPEDMDIFEPFKKGSRARTGSERGSGLGLAIVREVVAGHGGRCGAERRPAGGSTIWFEIPKITRRSTP